MADIPEILNVNRITICFFRIDGKLGYTKGYGFHLSSSILGGFNHIDGTKKTRRIKHEIGLFKFD